jgi:hypothetical protein
VKIGVLAERIKLSNQCHDILLLISKEGSLPRLCI